MRWTRRLLRRRPEPAPQHSETPGHREAKSALSRARQARREVEAHRQAVTHLAERLARERQRNHFAELFRSALEGGRR
ncbi:DUF7620 family protein (plasmid) [Streptomyces sp. GDS52]|uniref:DUF7620 family protein n=1 Tax=Streptomyces sp. GDS52 TaxID=3406419 RepID=UPI003FD5D22A